MIIVASMPEISEAEFRKVSSKPLIKVGRKAIGPAGCDP